MSHLSGSLTASLLLTHVARVLDALGVGLAVYGEAGTLLFENETSAALPGGAAARWEAGDAATGRPGAASQAIPVDRAGRMVRGTG